MLKACILCTIDVTLGQIIVIIFHVQKRRWTCLNHRNLYFLLQRFNPLFKELEVKFGLAVFALGEDAAEVHIDKIRHLVLRKTSFRTLIVTTSSSVSLESKFPDGYLILKTSLINLIYLYSQLFLFLQSFLNLLLA